MMTNLLDGTTNSPFWKKYLKINPYQRTVVVRGKEDKYYAKQFVDEDGLLRVGGRIRLDRSELPFEQKYPILIPNGHYLAK